MRRTLPSLLLLAAFAPATALAAFTPGPKVSVATGANPNAFVATDLNADGLTDFVSANTGGASASVLLGLGGGRFAPKVDYATGASPWAVAIGDVNGDGRLDAATANLNGSSCTLMLGDGLGGFPVVTTFAVAGGPAGVAIADLDRDGYGDIVVGNSTANSYSVFRGGPAGTSGLRVDVPCGTEPGWVALGDVNNDGKDDLVIARFNYACVEVRLGAGDRTFGAATVIATGGGPNHVFLADLNGDRRLDMVTTDNFDNTLSLFLNSAGGFGARTTLSTGTSPIAAAAGDVDNDGWPDLACANGAGSTVSVMINSGAGTFGARTSYVTGANNRYVAIADANGDGWGDVIGLPQAASTIVTIPALGTVKLGTPAAVTSLPKGFLAFSGELNGDGWPDLVTTTGDSPGFNGALGNGTTAFGTRFTGSGGATMGRVAIGDVTGDRNADLVIQTNNGATDAVSLFMGLGDGTFASRQEFTAVTGVSDVAIGDVTVVTIAQVPDVVTANSSAGTISVFEGRPTGLGPKSDFAAGTAPTRLAIARLNGDSYGDIAVVNKTLPGTISVFPSGAAAGTRVTYATIDNPTAIALADVTGDGLIDAIVGNASGLLAVHTGNGAGGFTSRADFTSAAGLYEIVTGDFNGDGKVDVAVTNVDAAASVSLFYGDGAGLSGVRQDFSVGSSGINLTAADFDADGITDLVVGNGASQWLYACFSRHRAAATIALSAAAATLGENVRVDVTVAPLAGTGTPTGTVRAFDGLTPVATGTLVGGHASLYVPITVGGDHAISVRYTGDGAFLGDDAPARTVRVISSYAPTITSIADVRNDQGRNARIVFAASGLDYRGSATPITQYAVYRKVAAGLSARPADDGDPATAPGGATAALLAGWDYVAAVPATTDGPYDVVVPTLADSNASGAHRATFLVRALTATPSTFWDSAADSGYTVDNLPPAPPSGFAGTFAVAGTSLRWNGGVDADLWYYRLYRGTTSSFTPNASTWIANTPNTSYTDPAGRPFFYKLSAVDQNGNESGFVSLQPAGTAGVEDGAAAFALAPPSPNPARGARLTVSFALASGAPATLELLDVSGRRVASREVGALGAGRHTAELSPGAPVAPGLYLVRLTQGGRSLTRRLSVIE